jgi:hypothetical protein
MSHDDDRQLVDTCRCFREKLAIGGVLYMNIVWTIDEQ